MRKHFDSIDEILASYVNDDISSRQLITYARKFEDDVINRTPFLDAYDASLEERLYCIVHHIDSIKTCKYCDHKASWTGHFSEGYREICASKDCRSRQLSDIHTGNTTTSNNRENAFILKQSAVTEVNDDTIKDLYVYDKYVNLTTNSILLNYLTNRFTDSASMLETVQRIRLGIEQKPLCPTCGKPVVWIGKKTKMFSTYCCNKCAGNNEVTKQKKVETQMRNWGTESCYLSSKYKETYKAKTGYEHSTQKPETKSKRHDTLLDRYGTTNLYQIEEIRDKIRETNIERFGYANIVLGTSDILESFRNGKCGYSFTDEKLMSDYNMYRNLVCQDISFDYNYELAIIKHFQGDLFYAHEMRQYATNPILRRKVIQNRMQYLGKRESELTANDIITGMRHSGLCIGYSHFLPQWTNWFVHHYDIKSVYDPCGGWGHHLLGILSCEHIVYNDASPSTVDNIRKMKDYFDITQLEIHNDDARSFIPADVNAFFMCPPYYNVETYECGGFASLDEYAAFLNDIMSRWHQNSAKIFGVIIREDFVGLINDAPAETFDISIHNRFNAAPKKNRERFYIFRKTST